MIRWNEKYRQWTFNLERTVDGQGYRWFRRLPKSVGKDEEDYALSFARDFTARIDADIAEHGRKTRRQFVERAKSLRPPTERQGYIYALSNPAYPGLLKIGKTTRQPEERAKGMSTGAPSPFKVEFAQLVAWVDQAEGIIHDKLSAFRVSPAREFFRVDVEAVREAVQAYIGIPIRKG